MKVLPNGSEVLGWGLGVVSKLRTDHLNSWYNLQLIRLGQNKLKTSLAAHLSTEQATHRAHSDDGKA